MLRIIITSLAIVFVNFMAQAQVMYEDYTLEFENLNLEKARDVKLMSAFKVEDGYIVLKKEPIRGPGGWHYFIEKFNSEFKSVGLQDITAQFEKGDYIIDGIVKVNDSYILFSTKDFIAEKQERLFAQTLDWENTTLSEPVLIHAQDYERRRKDINYSVDRSQDESHMLITIHPINGWNDNEKVQFKVYDNNLEESFSDEMIELEEADKVFNIKQTTLSNSGEIYILAGKYIPRDRKAGIEQSKTTYSVSIIDGTDVETMEIDMGDKIVSDISISFGDKGETYIGGYYSKEDGVGIDGVFLKSLNPKTGDLDDLFVHEFSKEFITEGWSDRQVKKADKKEDKGQDLGLSNLEFRSVMVHDDGSMSMIGEVFYITYHTSTNSNGTTTTRTVYHYADLVVTRISKDGEVVNNTRIDKHHTYSGAYMYFNLKNNFALLMNTKRLEIMGVDIDQMSKIDQKKEGGDALVLYKIDEEGSLDKSGIIDYRDDQYAPYRRYKIIRADADVVQDTGNTEVVLLTYLGRKQFALGHLTLR